MQRPDVLHTFGHVHRGCKKFRSVTHHGVLIKFSVLTSKELASWHQQSRTLRRQKCCRRSFFLSVFARLAPLASWSAIRSLWTFRHCPEAHQSTADTASPSDNGTKISTHEFYFFMTSYKVRMSFALQQGRANFWERGPGVAFVSNWGAGVLSLPEFRLSMTKMDAMLL